MGVYGRLSSVEELQAIRAGKVPGKALVFSAPANPPAWVPWPTSCGFWWHRTRPDGAPYVVEACGGPEEFWIYATGNECATYLHERRDGWEFTPAEPPRR